MSRRQPARLDGAPVTVVADVDALVIENPAAPTRSIDWVEMDRVVEGDHRVELTLADGSTVALGGLGATHDRFMDELRVARRRARFAALTITTGDPAVSYLSRASSGAVDVHLYDRVLVCEPRDGSPTVVPYSLIERVRRDGYSITITAVGLEPLTITALGVKTDEFLERLAAIREASRRSVAEAYSARAESLVGFDAPDGVAVTAARAGRFWPALRDMALAGSRSEAVQQLLDWSGERAAIGLFTGGGDAASTSGDAFAFVLAPIAGAAGDRIVVEATDGDDRATFVFAGADVERVNAALILTNFRREAIFLPEDQLGRWAVGARTWAIVREMRALLVGRVVHDEHWQERLAGLLGR